MMILRKTLPVAAVLAVLVGFLATPAPAQETTITVFAWGDVNERTNRRAQVAAFEAEHPDIHVEIEVIPSAGGEYDRKLQAQLSAGTAADVIMMAADWHGNLGRQGVFEDLRPYVERDGLDLKSVLLPGMDRGYTLPDGFREGMVITGASLAVAYNKDLFDQAGVPYPEPGWTWNDFRELALKLTRGEGMQKQYGTTDHWSVATLAPHIFGGRIFNEDETEVLADDPRVVEGLQFFLDLMKKDQVMPDVNASRSLPSDQRFFAGRAAMTFIATWDLPNFQRNIGSRFRWDVVPMPADPATGNQVTLIWTTGYAVNAASPNKEAAWEFVKFVSTNPLASEIASEVAIPSVAEVAHETFATGTGASLPDVDLRVFADSFAFGILNPLGGFFARINDEYNRAWESIMLDQTTPEEGMRQFAQRAGEILPQLIGHRAGS